MVSWQYIRGSPSPDMGRVNVREHSFPEKQELMITSYSSERMSPGMGCKIEKEGVG